MEKLVAVFACVVLVAVAEPIKFKDCSGNGTTVVVDISPCSVQPCVFTYNMTATVRVTFKAPVDSGSLKAQISGIIEGIRIGWPMPNPDGCKDSGITCPVAQSKQYTYVSTLAVPKGAPQLRLVVEWSLTGASGEKQFCFDFPMEISR
ncbi:NPC intracellular cholesterol transporter 2-like [Babylonia areolata]|uniref:NPC intracellular cholesterol transporter 2-like n=1 Tax=Babylonia areolata TaxID=304850 RepID=UPI003FD07AAB